MKSLIAKEQRARSIANIITGCSVVLFAILVYRVDAVFGFIFKVVRVMFPLTLGFVVAFLLDPPITTLTRLLHRLFSRLFTKKKRLLPTKPFRVLAAFLMYAALVALIFGFLAVVLPQLVDSIRRLITSVTRFLNLHQGEIQQFLRDFNWTGSSGSTMNLFNTLLGYWEEFAARSLSYTGQLVVGIVNLSASVGGMITEVLIGLIISVYMLFGKEKFAAQAKKLGCAIMPVNRVETLTFWFRKTHKVFSSYIVGQLVASLLTGVVCYIMMLIFRFDYALLISVIIGVTNVVPVFGPIIGAIIGIVILLIINPMSALWFGVFILCLQQLEGNIVAPRILGDSIGISSFWIMLSIMAGGGLFGLPGILLGIPVFAVIYSVVQMLVANRLKRAGMPPETAAYYGTGPLPERKTPLEAAVVDEEPEE